MLTKIEVDALEVLIAELPRIADALETIARKENEDE